MLNLFITYKCNFNCDYCFIRGFGEEYPMSLSSESFDKLCLWLKRNRVVALGVLGGEPTLHERLPWMLNRLNEIGVSPVLFTNGLFKEDLRVPLANTVANFVINYNDPSMYTNKQWRMLDGNLTALRAMDCRISFSKNFSKGRLRYNYIIEGALRHNIRSIRYDISRPNPLEKNNYFNLEESMQLTRHIVDFVKECTKRGIKTGLDCCIPQCFFSDEDLNYMKLVSMKFSGICMPSIDIHSDLSASYCIPMRDVSVPDVTAFSNEMDLVAYFSRQVAELRNGKRPEHCIGCKKFGVKCQGGCLALKKMTPAVK